MKEEVKKQGKLLRLFRKLQPNFSIGRLDLELALTTVLQEKRDEIQSWFGGDATQIESWPGSTARRIRTLLRHFSQAVLKSRGHQCTWVQSILWNRGSAWIQMS